MLYVLYVWERTGYAYLEVQDNCLLKELMKYKVQLLNSYPQLFCYSFPR